MLETLKTHHRKGLLLVGALLLASVLFCQPDVWEEDELVNYYQTQALVNHGSLFLDPYERELPAGSCARGIHGQLYSKFGIGYPLVAAFLLKSMQILHLEKVLVGGHLWRLPNCFFFLLSCYCFFLTLQLLFPKQIRVNVLISLGLLLSTQATYFGFNWSSCSFAGSLLTIALFFFCKSLVSGHLRSLLWAGALIASAALTRTDALIVMPGFIAALALSMRMRTQKDMHNFLKRGALFLAPVVGAVILIGTIDLIKLGQLGSPYGGEKFSISFFTGFLRTLFWPGTSAIFLAPMLVLIPIGFTHLYRCSRPLFTLCLIVSLSYVILYSQWWAPGALNRFWVPAIPFMLLPLASVRQLGFHLLGFIFLQWGFYTQLRLLPLRTNEIQGMVYKRFPYSEEADQVEKVLANGGLGRVLKVTFVDLGLYRGADCAAAKKHTFGHLKAGEKASFDPSLLCQEPTQRD